MMESKAQRKGSVFDDKEYQRVGEVQEEISNESEYRYESDPIDKGPYGFFLSMLNPHCLQVSVLTARVLLLLVLYVGNVFVSLVPSENLYALVGVVGSSGLVSLFLWCLIIYLYHYLCCSDERKGFLKPYDYFSIPHMIELVYVGLKGKMNSDKDDPREVELKHANDTDRIYDERVYEHSNNEIDNSKGLYTFDFTADIGDGFDSTFSIAKLMSEAYLDVEEIDNRGSRKSVRLNRGNSLIVGGDICYPISNKREMLTRFIYPYSLAFESERCSDSCPEDQVVVNDESPRMYIVIGNHEWIDGLHGVRKHLLPRKHIGGWSFPQTSTYYCIQMPKNWWMFVVDIGPEPEDINDSQRVYFENILANMNSMDTVIMVLHVPVWLKIQSLGFEGWTQFQELCGLIGERLRVVLSGDIHFYRRMELVPDVSIREEESSSSARVEKENVSNCFSTNKAQLYIAGHGGAFGHLTHLISEEDAKFPICKDPKKAKTYRTKTSYPTAEETKKIVQSKLLPGLYISGYSRLISFLYFLMYVATLPENDGRSLPKEILWQGMTSSFFFISIIILFSIIFATLTVNTSFTSMQIIGKALFLFVLQFGLHFSAAFGLKLSFELLFLRVLNTDETKEVPLSTIWIYCFVSNMYMLITGLIVGPFLTYMYYQIAWHVFRYHYSEIASAVSPANDSHKGFLRVVINESGDLSIYSIVINKIPRYGSNNIQKRVGDARTNTRLLEKVQLKQYPESIEVVAVV